MHHIDLVGFLALCLLLALVMTGFSVLRGRRLGVAPSTPLPLMTVSTFTPTRLKRIWSRRTTTLRSSLNLRSSPLKSSGDIQSKAFTILSLTWQ